MKDKDKEKKAPEKKQKPKPEMSDKDKTWLAVGVSLALVICLILTSPGQARPVPNDNARMEELIHQIPQIFQGEEITLTKSPSEWFTVPFTLGKPTHYIGAGIAERNVPYVIEYTAPSGDRWLEHVPSREEDPDYLVHYKGLIESARYWIEPECPVEEAHLTVYTISLGAVIQ